MDSSFAADESFHYKVPMVPSRMQTGPAFAVQPPAVRPLSSTDEIGPVAKKLRSAHQRGAPPGETDKNQMKPSKSAGAVLQGADDRPPKSSKARARPALTIANIFSSPGRRAQHAATSSRSAAANAVSNSAAANTRGAKEQPAGLTRRSSRLMGSKPAKVPPKVR